MFCLNCGNELKEGIKFCTKCGTPASGQTGRPPGGQAAYPASATAPGMRPSAMNNTGGARQSGGPRPSMGGAPPPVQHGGAPWQTGPSQHGRQSAHSAGAPPPQPPEPKPWAKTNTGKGLLHTPDQQRGGCFTILLVLFTIGGFFGIVSSFTGSAITTKMLSQFAPGAQIAIPQWIFIYGGITSAAQLAAAFGMWMWKRWGVILFFANRLLHLVVMAGVVHSPPFSMIIEIVILGVIFLVIRPYLDSMQ